MSTPARRRLLVAVSPRLLGDTLARVLAHKSGLEVVLHTDDGQPDGAGTPRQFDIGIVSGDLPEGISVDVLVRLPNTPTGAGVGRLRSRVGERDIILDDVMAIQRVIDAIGTESAEPVS